MKQFVQKCGQLSKKVNVHTCNSLSMVEILVPLAMLVMISSLRRRMCVASLERTKKLLRKGSNIPLRLALIVATLLRTTDCTSLCRMKKKIIVMKEGTVLFRCDSAENRAISDANLKL